MTGVFRILLSFAIWLSLLTFASALRAEPAPYPLFSMPNTQVRTVPVTSEGRRYALYIGLPESYGKVPGKRYPVVYVTDGYWDFTKVLTMGGSLAYDRVVPEYITVGLSYYGDNLNYGDLRRWELSPAPFGDNGEASGHALDFLHTLRATIIPMVDAEYETDRTYRVLAGSSLGGLFTLYTLLNDPQLFQAYIASSPAVTVNNDWLFRYEQSALPANAPTRLYITIGGNESPNYLQGVIRFNQRMAARQSASFAYAFHIVEEERHSGTTYESYVRGLRFAFLPRAPETGPAPGQ